MAMTNEEHYRATLDSLIAGGATIEAIADAIGCSVATVRQSRHAPGSRNYRAPPPGWQAGAVAILRRRVVADHKMLERVLALQKAAESEARAARRKAGKGRTAPPGARPGGRPGAPGAGR